MLSEEDRSTSPILEFIPMVSVMYRQLISQAPIDLV
jgi:hypothetical protein